MDEAMLCDQLTVLRTGQVLVTAPPEDIMQRGRTEVRIWRGNRLEVETVHGYYTELPRVLEHYGLDRSISRIELHEDSLETVILKIIEEAGE
jgi:ABC-type multidrug transport system ATPase subunit